MKAEPGTIDFATIAVALAAPLFLLRDSVFGGVLYERDIHLLWHGQIEGFVRSVAAGSWPVWDSWIGFGQPMLANPNTQVYYPPTWLNLLMAPWTYYTLYAVAHLAWAGLGMFALARSVGVSPAGARVASLVWMASGPLVSLVSMWNHLAGAAWMPWVVAAAVRLADEPSWRRAGALGAALGVQFLAGSPDMSAYTGLATTAVIVVAIAQRRTDLAQAGRLAGFAAGAATAAAALSAAQWMPTLDLVRESARWGSSGETRTYWSVHPLGALELLWPGIWKAIPLSDAGRTLVSESREPFLVSLYLGLPALGLVIAAFAGSRRHWALMAGIGASAVLVALGRHAPFYDAVATLFPVLRLSRFPVKALPLAAMAWACLAGMGWEAWRDAERYTRRSWLVVGGSLAATVSLGLVVVWIVPSILPSLFDAAAASGRVPSYLLTAALAASMAVLAVARAFWPRHARSLAAAALTIAAADLLAFHRNANPAAPRSLYLHRPEVVSALSGAVRVYARVPQDLAAAVAEPSTGLARIPEGWPFPAALALGQQMSLDSLVAARWGLRGSFSVDYMNLHPREVVELGSLLALAEGTPAYDRLLRLSGVTHVVTRDPRFAGTLVPVASFEGLLRGPVRVLAVPSPLPRLLVVGASRATQDPLALLDPAFDPTREVLLAEGPSTTAEDFAGRVEAAEERPDRIAANVRLSHPGYLVVLDTFAPGWRARVDGDAADVLRANHAFRAVRVPAGSHRVELEYRPRAVRTGIVVSLGTVVAAALAGAWKRWRRVR